MIQIVCAPRHLLWVCSPCLRASVKTGSRISLSSNARVSADAEMIHQLDRDVTSIPRSMTNMIDDIPLPATTLCQGLIARCSSYDQLCEACAGPLDLQRSPSDV